MLLLLSPTRKCTEVGTISGVQTRLVSPRPCAVFSFLLELMIRKNVFVFLLRLFCAMAISRVCSFLQLSFFPASALVFAVGITVGTSPNGALGELRASENKRSNEDNWKHNF